MKWSVVLSAAAVLIFLLLPFSNTAEASLGYRAVTPRERAWSIPRGPRTTPGDPYIENKLALKEIWGRETPGVPLREGTRIDAYQGAYHVVEPGDTLWLISRRYNTTVSHLMEENELNSDLIFPGQAFLIPEDMPEDTGPPGDSPDPGNNPPGGTFPTPGNGPATGDIGVPDPGTPTEAGPPTETAPPTEVGPPTEAGPGPGDSPGPGGSLSTRGIVYTVVRGDTLSALANRYQTSVQAIRETNRLNSDLLMVDQLLVIPENSLEPADFQVPREEAREGYGEYLEWPLASLLFNVGAVAEVTDLDTGMTFTVKRLGGGNHADVEPLTAKDTEILRQVYGGTWSWQARAILVQVEGRTLAASMNGMPHSIQTIHNNNFPGHICFHFLNSRTHNTNSIDPGHQAMVKKAAGL